MNVNKVAAELGKLGINILKIEQAEFVDCEDHSISVTESISVQVASMGNYMVVSHQLSESEFMMYPETKSLTKVVETVRECLGLVAA